VNLERFEPARRRLLEFERVEKDEITNQQLLTTCRLKVTLNFARKDRSLSLRSN